MSSVFPGLWVMALALHQDSVHLYDAPEPLSFHSLSAPEGSSNSYCFDCYYRGLKQWFSLGPRGRTPPTSSSLCIIKSLTTKVAQEKKECDSRWEMWLSLENSC